MQRFGFFFRSGLPPAKLGNLTRKHVLITASGISAAAVSYAAYNRTRIDSALWLKPWTRALPNVHADSTATVSSADASTKSTAPVWKTLKTRTVKGVHEMPFDMTLLQYETCPYCSKVCAFLDYYGLTYNLIEVNPLFRDELKKVTDKYRKVPLMIISDKNNPSNYILVPESALIISALKSLLSGFVPPPPVASSILSNKPQTTPKELSTTQNSMQSSSLSPVDIVGEVLKFYPPYMVHEEVKKTSWFGKKVKETTDYRNKYYIMYGQDHMYTSAQMAAAYREEVLWRGWVDNKFLHSLAPNIYRTLNESVHTFRYLSHEGRWEELFPAWKRELVVYVGAAVMWVLGKRVAKRHELSADPRYSMYDYANVWLTAVGKDRSFMGGLRPNLADLAVYGVLSAIEGTDAFRDLCRETRMGEWYFNTKKHVLSHEGAREAAKWQSNLNKLSGGDSVLLKPSKDAVPQQGTPHQQHYTVPSKDRTADGSAQQVAGPVAADLPRKRGYFFS